MRRRCRVGSAVLLLVLVAARPDGEQAMREQLGTKGLAILRGAERVEVLRVSPLPYGKPADAAYRETGRGKPGDAGFAKRLADILLGPDVRPGGTRCPFAPGVIFRALKGGEAVEVIVCFACNDLMAGVAGSGEAGRSPYPRSHFGRARPAVLKLAREALPDDKVLRDLPDAAKD